MMSVRGILFPFYWKITGHEKTVVFLPGRTLRDKGVPKFQRKSYFQDLPYNCISCFDPTLFYHKDLVLGWFRGRGSVFFAEILGNLVAQLMRAIGRNGRDLLVYGTSGGGIPAFNVAARVSGCTLYVSNIQTDARKYIPRFYREMVRVSYPGVDGVLVADADSSRLSVMDVSGDFRLIYSQNTHDTHHYERHFVPYVSEAAHKDSIFIVYSDVESGHDALGKAVELNIIHAVHQGGDVVGEIPTASLYGGDS